MAWVMQRPNGDRYLRMTNHGGEYVADKSELLEKIAEYEEAIHASRKALALLGG